MPIIEVKGLAKEYVVPAPAPHTSWLRRLIHRPTKRHRAVDALDFAVQEGEVVGLLGPNGAGKTTTIKCLTGILRPTAGRIAVAGYDPQRERYTYTFHIGLVMGQKSLLLWDVPVMESLKLYRDIYELPEAQFRRRLDEYAGMLDLEPLLSMPVRKLSLGQRMRAEFVAAMLHRPKVVFLDEPTIGLDVRAEFVGMRQFALNFAMQSVQLPIAMLVLLYIYRTITGGGLLGAYSAVELAAYFVGVAVSTQVAQPAFATMWESWEQINSGDLSGHLCRPVDYLWFRYARKLAPALVMAVCAGVIQTAVRLSLGTWSLVALIQFMLSALLAFSLWFMWWFAMGALSFWWERPFGLRDILWNVIAILSGQMIPLDLVHPTLQRVMDWLPFAGLSFVPAALFAGRLVGEAAWAALATQALWLIALTVAARTLWRQGVRTYDGRGG